MIHPITSLVFCFGCTAFAATSLLTGAIQWRLWTFIREYHPIRYWFFTWLAIGLAIVFGVVGFPTWLEYFDR